VAQQKPAAPEMPKQGPFEIPFEQNDLKLIQQDRELRRTFIQMRYRAEEETLVLSIPATIKDTIQSGGCPQLAYAPLTQQQQYVVLIDRANPKSMLTRLFSWLVNSIADDGIPVAIFYYDKNFMCYSGSFPGGLALQRLAETHTNATLIIIGKAYELVYAAYPVIEEKFLRELNRWQSKAIITPLPIKDWSAKEKVLLQNFILLPADTSSLQKLMPALREKIKPNTSLLEITAIESYSIKDTDFQDIAALRSYLNNDETLFQWLCAACIYPRLNWEVLVEIGKAILDKYGEPEKLNYTNLLKLCRISWMQQGVFPQITRLELLKTLSAENEICARQQLLQMLDYSTSLYGESGCFFEEEKKRQQLTNQFILHASDKEQFVRYAHSIEAFRKIWKKDAILDMPLKKYLDKTAKDKWQTPVSNGIQSVGLTAYFDLQETRQKKRLWLKKGLAAATAVLLLAVWTYLQYGDGAKKLEPLVFLGKQDNPPGILLSVKVIKAFSACGDTAQQHFDQLDGYLDIDNEKIPLTWDPSTATAVFEVPYKSMQSGKASIMLSWTQNKSVNSRLVFVEKLFPDSVTIACQNRNSDTKKPLYIRYNDTSGYKEIENTLVNSLYAYTISALPADFGDSSRIVYYEPNQKPRADSIVAILAQTLGLRVAEDFIREERTPPATPILFINTAKDTPVIEPAEERRANARDHHLMGDQYYSENQYQKALDEYTQAISLDPKDALAYYNRGLCYEGLANNAANKTPKNLNTATLEKALKEYNAAIGLNARDALSWYRKASIKYSLKRYAEAIPDYTKVVSINSPEMKRQIPLSIYFRGKSYYFLKDPTRACEDFKRSAALGVNAGKQDYAAYCGKTDPSQTDSKNPPPPMVSNQTATAFGYIELDQQGYTDAAGQQVMQRVSGLLKAQPAGKLRLTAMYTSEQEQKMLAGYMNTIVNMFAKIGVNTKTQIEQRLQKTAEQVQQQNQNNAPAAVTKRLRIQVTGINLRENSSSAK
jgi:tetratricopeptide (TPR) repeat protein